MSILTLEHITKVYGEGPGRVVALDDVTLSLHARELVLLMGPSGSGKTTLLSILGCMLKPSSGRVLIAGQDVTELGEEALPLVRRTQIGYIFQGFNLFPALTALENVMVVLELKGWKRKAAREEAHRLLCLVGLEERLSHLPADLSGGQKQRVAVARAMADAPPILLADEPTAALDTKTGAHVMGLIRDLVHAGGHAGMIVTHDPRLLGYADRVLELEDGRLVNRAEQPSAYAQPSLISVQGVSP